MEPRKSFPEWWDWELEFSSELPDRMQQRGFGEVDLREMLHEASEWAPDKEEGRFAIRCKWEGRTWEVIVEPDPQNQRLVVITAFRLEY